MSNTDAVKSNSDLAGAKNRVAEFDLSSGKADFSQLHSGLSPKDFSAIVDKMVNRGSQLGQSDKIHVERDGQGAVSAIDFNGVDLLGKTKYAVPYDNHDSAAVKPETPEISNALSADGKKLIADAQVTMTPAQLQKFTADTAGFEASRDELATRLMSGPQALSLSAARTEADSRIRKAEDSIDKLLTQPAVPGGMNKVALAQSFMQESNPTDSLNAPQGGTSSCMIAAFNKIIYVNHPEKVADALEQVGTTGEYKFGDRIAKVDLLSESTANQSKNGDGSADTNNTFGKRSYADQIMQSVTGQISVEDYNQVLDQTIAGENQKKSSTWLGLSAPDQSILDAATSLKKNAPSKYTDGGAMSAILGQTQESVYKEITGDSRTVEWAPPVAGSATDYDQTIQDVKKQLADFKKDGDLPISISVKGWHPYADGRNSVFGGHQILLSDYNESAQTVTIHGSEGMGAETMTLDQLVSGKYSPVYSDEYRVREQDDRLDHHTNIPEVKNLERITNPNGSIDVINLDTDPGKSPYIERWDSSGKLTYRVFPDGTVLDKTGDNKANQ